MTHDPVLEGLIAAGVFVIAADRYEEETGDTELAALMRIPGLEWELVDGKPVPRLIAEERDPLDWPAWYELRCGTVEVLSLWELDESLDYFDRLGLWVQEFLHTAGLHPALAPRMFALMHGAVGEMVPAWKVTSGLQASPCPATP